MGLLWEIRGMGMRPTIVVRSIIKIIFRLNFIPKSLFLYTVFVQKPFWRRQKQMRFQISIFRFSRSRALPAV